MASKPLLFHNSIAPMQPWIYSVKLDRWSMQIDPHKAHSCSSKELGGIAMLYFVELFHNLNDRARFFQIIGILFVASKCIELQGYLK